MSSTQSPMSNDKEDHYDANAIHVDNVTAPLVTKGDGVSPLMTLVAVVLAAGAGLGMGAAIWSGGGSSSNNNNDHTSVGAVSPFPDCNLGPTHHGQIVVPLAATEAECANADTGRFLLSHGATFFCPHTWDV